MIIAVSAANIREAVRMVVGGVPHAENGTLQCGPTTAGSATRWGYAPGLSSHGTRSIHSEVNRGGGYTPAGTSCSRSIARTTEVLREGGYHMGRRRQPAFDRRRTPPISPRWCDYRIISIETVMAEDDWEGWATQ
jgi:enolase